MTENALTPSMQEEIEKKVKELKAANPKIRKVYPIIVDGEEEDEKDFYIGYFRRPSFDVFSKFLTASQSSNNAIAMRALAKDCFIDGDRELVDDDDIFLFGTMAQLNNIIEMRHGQLVNLSKPGK